VPTGTKLLNLKKQEDFKDEIGHQGDLTHNAILFLKIPLQVRKMKI
jgi:hypothetical protein